MASFSAIIRTISLWVYLALWTPVCVTAAVILSMLDRLGWSPSMTYFGDFPTRHWSRGLLWAGNTTFERIGHLPEKASPFIIMSNHRSHLDGPALLVTLKPVSFRFLVKWELAYVPFIGAGFWAIGMVFVKRGNRESARKSIDNVVKRVARGGNVVVFPEGTRSRGLDGSEMLHFKKGGFIMAQKGGVPILPVGIAGSAEIYGHGWFARQWKGHIVINVGKPIETTGYSEDQIDALADCVRAEIGRLRAEAHVVWEQRARELGLAVPALSGSPAAAVKTAA